MRRRDGGNQETGSSSLARAVEQYELVVVVVKMEANLDKLRAAGGARVALAPMSHST